VELGVDFAIQGDPTPKGREVMFVLGEDPREGIAPLALPAQVYNTRAHQELLNALFAKTKSLKNDDFAFKNGVAAFAIAGAMGEFRSSFFFSGPLLTFPVLVIRHWQDHHVSGVH